MQSNTTSNGGIEQSQVVRCDDAATNSHCTLLISAAIGLIGTESGNRPSAEGGGLLPNNMSPHMTQTSRTFYARIPGVAERRGIHLFGDFNSPSDEPASHYIGEYGRGAQVTTYSASFKMVFMVLTAITTALRLMETLETQACASDTNDWVCSKMMSLQDVCSILNETILLTCIQDQVKVWRVVCATKSDPIDMFIKMEDDELNQYMKQTGSPGHDEVIPGVSRQRPDTKSISEDSEEEYKRLTEESSGTEASEDSFRQTAGTITY